jgi:hypothetical protein
MPQQPTSSHDWALWLFEHLEAIECAGANWQGRLPPALDFSATVESIPKDLLGFSDSRDRTIEFHPEFGHVYSNMAAFVQGQRQRDVPVKFTVIDIGYTHGKTESVPEPVRNYLDTVKLWQLLKSFADYEVNQRIAFIKSYESKVEVRPEFAASDLVPLSMLSEFGATYFESNHHHEEKRNIVRASLLEVCKGMPVVRLADLLPKYGDLVDRVKSSYTMYTVDFSFEKLRSEVDSKNVEDMLRLNKTLADIQNQLLALPAAMLIAGAGVKADSMAANLTIWFGVTVFAWVMQRLVVNQQHSVAVIDQEVNLRLEKVTAQPPDISNRVRPLFSELQARLAFQRRTLKKVGGAVWVVWLAVTAVAINAQWPSVFPSCISWLSNMAEQVCDSLLRLAGEHCRISEFLDAGKRSNR